MYLIRGGGLLCLLERVGNDLLCRVCGGRLRGLLFGRVNIGLQLIRLLTVGLNFAVNGVVSVLNILSKME